MAFRENPGQYTISLARTWLPGYHLPMPRLPRVVIPGIAHHVTQRGNRRLPVFFGEADFALYRELIAEGCRKARVRVLAWCLMPNHVHLVVVPDDETGLRGALAEAHRRYTTAINRREGWRGHLWQERFHSFPMDDEHLVVAVRYVELNPVRARLVLTPEAWRWSSAGAHAAGRSDGLVAGRRQPPLDGVGPWLAFLAEGLAEDAADAVRRHERSGRPLGGPQFVARLERQAGRPLAPRPPGRPRSRREVVE